MTLAPLEAKPRRGRPPSPSGKREAILATARRHFAERGFAAVRLREIARDAGVDAALVRHYFPHKESLFAASMRLPFDPAELAQAIFAGDPDRIGERLATRFVEIWETQPGREVMLGLVSAALTDAKSATLLREVLKRFVLGPLAGAVGGQAAVLRAELAGSHLFGVGLARYVLKVEPLASMPPSDLVNALAPALNAYLTQ